jgi:hypothetical protein
MKFRSAAGSVIATLGMFLLASITGIQASQAQKFKVLHTFDLGKGGGVPMGGLTLTRQEISTARPSRAAASMTPAPMDIVVPRLSLHPHRAAVGRIHHSTISTSALRRVRRRHSRLTPQAIFTAPLVVAEASVHAA